MKHFLIGLRDIFHVSSEAVDVQRLMGAAVPEPGRVRRDLVRQDDPPVIPAEFQLEIDQLNADKKKLEGEFIRLEREKAYQRENEYDALDLLFRGVNLNNPLALKKRYKDLMKMFHPYNFSGDQEMVQLINQEYSALCRQNDVSMIN